MEEDLVIIGKLLRTHGIKGALKVAVLTDVPGRLAGLSRVILEAPSGIQMVCTLTSVGGTPTQAILAFSELTSPEEARAFVGGWVKIPREEAVPLSEDRFYHFDLVGMEVYFTDGKFLGTLEEIIETGSNDVFVVRNERKEFLIPATRQVVREVNIEQHRMTLSRIEGLVENNAL